MSWPTDVQALRRNTVLKIADYSATPGDFTIRVDASAGPVTIGAVTETASVGQLLFIKKIDASASQVTFNPTDPVDGGDSVAITTQYETKLFQFNGTAWDVLY